MTIFREHFRGLFSLLAITFLLLWLLALRSEAATLTKLQGEDGFGCTHELTGTIDIGDGARILRQMGQGYQGFTGSTICLDSRGGSLLDGIELAKNMFGNGIGTVIPPEAECLSACAIVFMAGNSGWEDSFIGMRRTMYPTASLGFHAPALVVGSSGSYTPLELEGAYGLAIRSIEALVNLDERIITRELLAHIVGTPPHRMYMIDTVARLVEINADIALLGVPRLPLEQMIDNGCDNLGYTPDIFTGNGREYDPDWQPDYFEGAKVNSIKLTGQSNYVATGLQGSSGEDYYLCEASLSLDSEGVRAFFKDADRSAHLNTIAVLPPGMTLSRISQLGIYSMNDLAAMAGRDGAGNASELSCTYGGSSLRVINVNEFVNIRNTTSLSARIVARAARGEMLTSVAPNKWWFQNGAAGSICSELCNRASTGAENDLIATRLLTCIKNARIWMQVRNSLGQDGYVSVNFLEEY